MRAQTSSASGGDEYCKILGKELRVQRTVGSGGFGDVLLVTRTPPLTAPQHSFVFPPQCVVKVMRAGMCNTAELELARREVAVLKSLQHPNTVRYIGSWTEMSRGQFFKHFCVALQYCEGGDLAALVKRCKEEGKLPPADVVVRLIAQVFSALNYSHSCNLIHRDIKPGNVFLTKREDGSCGDAVVGDFGLVRSLEATRDQVATRVGTPSYISPEIVLGERYSAKTDIFSAGTMFYELMSMRRPFYSHAVNWEENYQRILSLDPMPFFRDAVGRIYGAALTSVIEKCLAKREADRASAYDVLVNIVSPVPKYVRSHAIPVYMERQAAELMQADRRGPASAQTPSAANCAADNDTLARGGEECAERDGAQKAPSAAARHLAKLFERNPELLMLIHVLVEHRCDDDAHLEKGLRDVLSMHGYELRSSRAACIVHYVLRHAAELRST